MSVMAWRATRKYSGEVARISALSTPARRPAKRDTHRYNPQIPSTPIRQKGSRSAHSARVPRAIAPGAALATPNRRKNRLMIQNDSTGFDQKWSASMGAPGHHRLM